MSVTAGATLTLAVLAAAGALPTLALVGTRWMVIPLAPLGGAVVAALAATVTLALGAPFMMWFVALSVVSSVAAVAIWVRWPSQRPRPGAGGEGLEHRRADRLAGVLGAVGILAASAWSLRALSSPTVGFDARALWIMRAGWFLHPHAQLLVDMRLPQLALNQSAYPPLVSAAGSVAWSITGDHTDRLAVVVTALLNTCALATAAFALVECGRQCHRSVADRTPDGSRPHRWLRYAPLAAGVAAGVLLVPIAFGLTEPFMTNGYADPLWSLAALGALAYGLQLGDSRSNQGVTVLLLLVAGLSKDEGFVTAAALIGVVALRRLATLDPDQRRRGWWPPVVVAGLELATLAAWPLLMRVIHARGIASTYSSPSAWPGRARATFDGFTPYLHVLLVAIPVAVIGGLVLARVRRVGGVANDWWAWTGLASGLVAVGGALVTGSDSIQSWLVTTVHRVTEFPALAGWWILAVWLVVGVTAVSLGVEVPDSPAEVEGAPPAPATAVPVGASTGGSGR